MQVNLQELNRFLGKAANSTYAAGGAGVDPETPGFKELEYREGAWYYRDSYSGFFQSWGRETVWYTGRPCWTQIYGGGMLEKYRDSTAFAHQTFDFLKQALSTGEKQTTFQPRGPAKLTDDVWEYRCTWQGDICRFSGHEEISYNKDVVFTHDFLGGLIVAA